MEQHPRPFASCTPETLCVFVRCVALARLLSLFYLLIASILHLPDQVRFVSCSLDCQDMVQLAESSPSFSAILVKCLTLLSNLRMLRLILSIPTFHVQFALLLFASHLRPIGLNVLGYQFHLLQRCRPAYCGDEGSSHLSPVLAISSFIAMQVLGHLVSFLFISVHYLLI